MRTWLIATTVVFFLHQQPVSAPEATSPPPAVESSGVPQEYILYSIAASTILSMFGVFVALYKENRNRKWDMQDRAQARADLAATHQAFNTKLDESKDLSAQALGTANHFNQKLTALMEQFHIVEGDAARAASLAADAQERTNMQMQHLEQIPQVVETLNAIDERSVKVANHLGIQGEHDGPATKS